jgi:hypothetical protein
MLLYRSLYAKTDGKSQDDDEIRVQQVRLSRDVNRSLFNLCWKTIFKGIQGTAGIKQAATAKVPASQRVKNVGLMYN